MTKVERKIRLDKLTGIVNFINLAERYECTVRVKGKQSIVDGKSIMGVVSQAVYQPLTIIAEGADALDFAGQLDKMQFQ